MPSAPMVEGRDISRYNAGYKIEPGVEFVFIKATEGTVLYNTEFANQRAMCRAAGVVTGFYHWLKRGNIDGQAQAFVDTAEPLPGEILVCDWEEAGVTVADKNQFIAEVKRLRPKNRVLLYCNASWWNGSDKKAGDGLWVAHYGVATPNIREPWLIHQYTDKPMDKNRAQFASRTAMRAWALGGEPPVPAAPTERISWRGRKACRCMIDNIEKVVEPRLKKAGIIKNSIDIFQAAYSGSSLSAGTHLGGGAIDVAQYGDPAVKIWRESGWAFWRRVPPAFDYHGHGILNGCPHVSSSARDQITDYKNGRNGLANNGPDPGPRITLPTWRDAIAKYTDIPTSQPPASGGGGTPATDEIGDLMTDWKRFDTGKDQRLVKAGKWQFLKINDAGDVSFASGPCKTIAFVNVQASIPIGSSIWMRIVEVDVAANGKETTRVTYKAQKEIAATKGDTFDGFAWGGSTGAPKAGGTVRLRVLWHSWDPKAYIKWAEVGRFSPKG